MNQILFAVWCLGVTAIGTWAFRHGFEAGDDTTKALMGAGLLTAILLIALQEQRQARRGSRPGR